MRRTRWMAMLAALLLPLVVCPQPAGAAAGYVPITGSGSTWSQNAIDQWSRDVKQNGLTVNYTGNGSSAGRSDFQTGQSDFGVSEIPYQRTAIGNIPAESVSRSYGYMPIVAGGTSFMYHLNQNGKQVTNLRLSGLTIAKIFTGAITNWSDPAIKADMNGISMPNEKITPVLRSDGSGTTAQFTRYLSVEFSSIWQSFSHLSGLTSYYPSFPGSKSQNGSNGVAGYVSASYGEGSIGYVEYSYALNDNYPVVKVLNKAGYYVLPTASNVGIGLQKAQINTDPNSQDYLTQILDGVYNDTDQRTYPLSSYSYMIIPTKLSADERPKPIGSFTADKGRTLTTFINYFLCTGQQKAPQLGYSPLPSNLVLAAYDQMMRIPGHIALGARDSTFLNNCNNPTFQGGVNTLLKNAPNPAACDKQGVTPCGSTQPSSSASPGAGGGNGNKGNTGNNGNGSNGSNGNGQNNNGGNNANGGTVNNAFAEPVQVGPRAAYGPAMGFAAGGILLLALLAPPLVTGLLRGRRRTRGEES